MANGPTTASKTQQMIKEAEEIAAKKKNVVKTDKKTEEKVEVQDKKFAEIQKNTFYQIVFSDKTLEQKKEAVAQALAYNPEEDKSANLERLAEFDLFKEYMQSERKRMSMEIIKLTDTGVFGELKEVIDQMNGAVVEFDKSMNPLTSIIDAVYKLRKAGEGVTNGVFAEIQADKAAEADREKALKEQSDKLAGLQGQIDDANKAIAVLGTDKPWYRFGKLSRSAEQQIALKQLDLQKASGEVATVAAELETLKAVPTRESQFAELQSEKAKLRELLDITTGEHKERQERLVNAALNFVNTTENRVGNILTHFGDLKARLQDIDDANGGMQSVYAVLTEATTDAGNLNQKLRENLTAKEGAVESPLEKLKRENNKTAVEEHIKAMMDSSLDTASTFAEVTNEAFRIKTAKDTTGDQISKTRRLHSAGVAGMASRLSSVLNAVNSAAINESAEATQNTLALMNDKTNAITMQEAIRSAMGVQDTNNSMTKAIDELADLAEGIKSITTITSSGLEDLVQNKKKIESLVGQVQDNLKEAKAVNAEVNAAFNEAASNDNKEEKPATAPAASKKPATESPLKKMKM